MADDNNLQSSHNKGQSDGSGDCFERTYDPPHPLCLEHTGLLSGAQKAEQESYDKGFINAQRTPLDDAADILFG